MSDTNEISLSRFQNAMSDTHAYVGNTASGRDNGSTSYLYKGTGHMVGVKDWEPQRTNNFELVIEGLDTLVRAGSWDSNIKNAFGESSSKYMGKTGSGEDPGRYYPRLKNAAERLMLSVDSFTAPTLEIAQITTHYGNNSIKWAGKPEFPNGSVTINDYIGIGTEQIMSEWFRAAYNFENECVGLAKDYKKTGYLIEYDPSGGQARVWRLDGCWLATFDLGEWAQEGNNQRKMKGTLVYDRIVPDYIDSSINISSPANTPYYQGGVSLSQDASNSTFNRQSYILNRWNESTSYLSVESDETEESKKPEES